MDLYGAFVDLPRAGSEVEFAAVSLSDRRPDFLAKALDGSPVFLLHDASKVAYSPGISLKNLSVQFHCSCRVLTSNGTLDDQFAVVTCDDSVPELYELFVRCFAAAVAHLPESAGTDDLSQCFRGLLDLFRAFNRPNNREVTGLWAELYVIKSCPDIANALSSWRLDQFETFDFSSARGCLEVKATTNEMRVHDFTLEQLQTPLSGEGYVASLLLQSQTGGAGVMDLAREIEAAVLSHPILRQKLWENVASALGSDFSDRLDRQFDLSYAQRNLVLYAMRDVPKPEKPNDARVTAIRFRSDLSQVLPLRKGDDFASLGRLFR